MIRRILLTILLPPLLSAFAEGEDAGKRVELDMDRFAPGVKLFTDRTYKLTEEAPEFLRGMEFIRCSINGVRRLVCAEPGTLYVLTPAVREGAASQTKALQALGYKRHAMPEFQLFPGRDIERVLLFTKKLEKGDKVGFGKWTVLLAPKMLLERSEVARFERLYNGITMASEPAERTDMTHYGRDPLPVPYLTDVPDVIPIDIGRQLFVDDFLIAETTLRRTWHKAVKDSRNPVMKPETELERGIKNRQPAMAAPFSGGVWYDGTAGLFKAWYCAGWFDGTAYAFSKDGIHWERPELKAEPGTNRIVPREGTRDSCAVVMDPHVPPNGKRFKMLLWSRPQGGELFVSGNGTDWSEPVATGDTGDRSTIFYNPFRRKWIYSLRSGWAGRARDYSESADFLGGAPFLDKVPWLRVDNLDLPDKHWLYARPEQKPERGGDTPQLYNFDAVAYESLMLGAFTVHLGPDNDACSKARVPKITELHLGFSRDGFHWSRSDDRTPFIPASRTAGTWDRAYLHSNAALCVIVDDELWFYYTGFQGDYTGWPDETRPGGMYTNASMGIARLRRDGFASMEAGPEGGELTTRPIRFTRGDLLFVNVNDPKGSLRAEIADADGAPIEGFTFADSAPLAIDSTRAMMTWKGDENLTALHNRPVRIRFKLTNGALYAFWFAAKTGASRGYLAGGSKGHSGLVDDDISGDN